MRSRVSGIWWVVVVAVTLSALSIHFSAVSVPRVSGLDDIQDAPHFTNESNTWTGNSSSRNALSDLFISYSANDHTEPSRPHPHAGARYANGSWGYIADVTMVRRFVMARYHHLQKRQNSTCSSGHCSLESHLYFRDDREFQMACQALPREGKERKAGWRLLTQKVQVNGSDPVLLENELLMNESYRLPKVQAASTKTPRILCAVYTYDKHREMVTGIADTWGWKCDGFFAASTETVMVGELLDDGDDDDDDDDSRFSVEGMGSIDLPHLGPETYENMWQKTRSILSYMHDHYLQEYDFFFLSGDDTYVIVENLRRTLQWLGDAAWEQPLYLGHWVPYGSQGSYFCGGGPGYVLNRKTLEILIREVFPVCQATLETSSEDRMLGQCLKSVAGIVGNHSVDATGAQRFHGLDPHDVCTKQGDSGFMSRLYEFWGQHYGFRSGFNLTSSQSVSFHLLKTTRHMKRIHAILYKSCPPNTTLGDILGPSLTAY